MTYNELRKIVESGECTLEQIEELARMAEGLARAESLDVKKIKVIRAEMEERDRKQDERDVKQGEKEKELDSTVDAVGVARREMEKEEYDLGEREKELVKGEQALVRKTNSLRAAEEEFRRTGKLRITA